MWVRVIAATSAPGRRPRAARPAGRWPTTGSAATRAGLRDPAVATCSGLARRVLDGPPRAEPQRDRDRIRRIEELHDQCRPIPVAEASRLAGRVLDEVEKAVVGKRDALTLVLAAVLAKGHVLLEDFPGLGKTLAARSFAPALGLDFARAQFTPDLLPADLTGSFVYDQRQGTFEFRRGPLFTGLLLADEINRTPPKTQSALLEAMQERQVTVEGETFPLRARSTCSRPPTRSSTRAPTRCRRRSSTGSCCGSASATPPRRGVRRPRAAARPAAGGGRRSSRSPTRAGLLRDAGGGRDGDRRRERRPLLRRPGRGDPRAPARADRRLAPRLARAGAGRPGLRGDPRARLRHARGRQGGGPVGAVAPDHGQAGALDDPGQRAPGRRRGARRGADARRRSRRS